MVATDSMATRFEEDGKETLISLLTSCSQWAATPHRQWWDGHQCGAEREIQAVC